MTNLNYISLRLLPIILLLGSSAGHKPKNDSIHDITFQQDASYGTTDDVVVGRVAAFTVDDKNRVFIADQDNTTIQVFNPGGSFLTSIGRQGHGPGEFATVTGHTTLVVDSKRLYIINFANSSDYSTIAQVFSLNDLSFSHTMKLVARNIHNYKELNGYFPRRIYPYNDGTFLVAYRKPFYKYLGDKSFVRYVVQDRTGKIISGPILEQKDLTYLVYKRASGDKVMYSFDFFPKSLLAKSSDDHLYAANTEMFKISIYSSSGKFIRSFHHPFQNIPVTKNGLIDRYQKKDMSRLGEGVAVKMIREADNLPDSWPALHSMFFDDQGRLWVSTIVDDFDVYQWWVLKKTGEVITKFKWPRDKPIKVVRNGHIYTRETNNMGVTSIVRYKIMIDKVQN